MTTKMKGLLKGLRYISQIFDKEDDEEEEEEMQIGFPTDVKHVAHIGWDGPAVSSPSWMNEFKAENSSNPLSPSGAKETPPVKLPSQDYGTNGGLQDSLSRNLPELPKPSKRRTSKGDSSSSFESCTSQELRDVVPKQSSRRQKSGDSSDSTKPSRRQKNSTSATDPADPLAIPKQSKAKKKSKGSSADGSTSTKLRTKSSESNNNETCPPSGFE